MSLGCFKWKWKGNGKAFSLQKGLYIKVVQVEDFVGKEWKNIPLRKVSWRVCSFQKRLNAEGEHFKQNVISVSLFIQATSIA